jgi:hypothetical protein
MPTSNPNQLFHGREAGGLDLVYLYKYFIFFIKIDILATLCNHDIGINIQLTQHPASYTRASVANPAFYRESPQETSLPQ